MDKIKILFVLGNLGGGGAQRVSLNILRHINREQFIPALALVNSQGDYMELLPDDVVIHDLKARRARYAFLPLAHLVGRVKPSIVFSTAPYVDQSVCLASGLRPHFPKLVFRSPNFTSVSGKEATRAVRLMTRWSYSRASMVIASTQAMKRDLQTNLRVPPSKTRVIPNPLDLTMIHAMQKEPANHPWFKRHGRDYQPTIIAVGSLEKQKGFSYLLRAFALAASVIPSRLAILGKGKQRNQLEALVTELDIVENVSFMGFQQNPFKYLARSDLFVLSSLWEGFPNVLVEAMACGTPVVSTDCPSGPNEIISHETDGLLVPPKDPEALAEAILRVLKDSKLAAKLAENGRARVADFEAKRIVKQYEELFRQVAQERA